MAQTPASFESFDLYYKYAKEVEKYPLLNKKAEQKLLKKIKAGDEKALNQLVCSNLRFVIKIAFMYRGKGLAIGELINEGNLGLIRAAREFNPEKKVRFITYAVWWVRQSITQALAEKSRTVRIPAYNEMILSRISRVSGPQKQFIGGDMGPDVDVLSENLQLAKTKVEKVLKNGGSVSSLEDYQDSEMLSAQGELEYELNAESQAAATRQILKSLKPREQKVLKYFFGLDSHKIMNLREISEILNISRERVRQIKEAALDKLRDLKIKRELITAS